MKKLLITCSLLVGTMSSLSAWADAASVLQTRLAKVNSFQANFTQTVLSAEGNVVQQGEGTLWLKRPNLFNWHMHSPDESVLISDGKTLWFYNPFVEQVTASWLKDATGNTPFILLTRNNANDWKQYDVRRLGDDFELTPKVSSNHLKQLLISVSNSGTIKSFTAIEQDGQRSDYQLKGQQNRVIEAEKFRFTPPKGVTLDDQRN
ncbi:outer membrane lipoprotein chaperone LolA [Serratia microhaemolytica]|uniref:outer membrane lipoprotein chaperone LolA n=1 Tax=Serratia microhaemolytica TaxID=2675110 RepID=UPI000FDD1384|nr:outer membrane lipoprotein chaperone LolA [Serratia microhaemolytica]